MKDIAEVRTNFEKADFWLIRKGDIGAVGKPTKQFSAEAIGIKVTSPDVLPDYLYYAMMHLHAQGLWRQAARGTLRLVNITVKQVADLALFERPVRSEFDWLAKQA